MNTETVNLPLGHLVVTQGVNLKIADDPAFGLFVAQSIQHHRHGEWGELTPDDIALNDAAINPYPDKCDRILSAYTYPGDSTKILIITEWDRSVTTVLFPDEY